jgi:hypothetical protein
MRIVFVLRHSGYVRNFESALRLLAERGHEIELAFDIERSEAEIAERLESELGIRHGYAAGRHDAWTMTAYGLRFGIDYLRYLDDLYRDAPKLRERGERDAPDLVRNLSRAPLLRTRGGRRALGATLRAFDRAIPTSAEIDAFLAERRPDLVIVTPLVDGPMQTEYVRSARRLGIPSALAVASWDNLTNKGLVRDVPDRVLVWNEVQRREAIELHGVLPEQVKAVGAHTFDHWFAWRPSTSRDEFLARVGLPAGQPYLLYTCSSGFIVQDERPVIDRWLRELRTSGIPELEQAGVMIRPHPLAPRNWEPFGTRENVVVWPPTPVDPRSRATRDEYFDSIFHSAAVVGVNTSCLIEAAIVGRKSYTFPLPELREGQQGTIHFRYLVEENGGPLSVAGSFAEHAEQLGVAIGSGVEPGWADRFLESFIRPQGLDRDATPLLVEELEALGQAQPVPVRRAFSQAALAGMLLPLRKLNVLYSKNAWKALERAWSRNPELADTSPPPARMARGPLARIRRALRRTGYGIVHALLPARVRQAVRMLLGRPNRYEAKLAAKKEARAARKGHLASAKRASRSDTWAAEQAAAKDRDS